MREIKFRAWDKKNHKYFRECDWLSFASGGIRFMWVDSSTDEMMVTELPTADYELLQYTGLKDKSGKEIYEGDIVQSIESTHRGQVCYRKNASFGVYNSRWSGAGTCDMLEWEWEVIGNIYENPELQKGEECEHLER